MSVSLSYEELAAIMYQKQLCQYLSSATATVLIYDTLTSLDQEISYIWQSHWSLIKILYLWSRYQNFVVAALELWFLVFPGGPMAFACYKPTFATIWLAFTGICVSEILLFIRTWAVWERKRAIAALLSIQGLTCIVTAIYTTWQFAGSTDILEIEGTTGCIGITRGELLKSSWGLLLVSESACLILLLLKSYISYWGLLSFSTVFRAIFTDGILYFILIVVLVLTMLIPTQTRPELDLTLMISIPGSMLHSTFVAHLILHLRKVADPAMNEVDATLSMSLPLTSH